MKIVHEEIQLHTKGNPDFRDITDELSGILERSALQQGLVTVFVAGSTAGIITAEYEPGLVRDLEDFYEKLAPHTRHYHHDETWGDANGFSHLRASLAGSSLSIPFSGGKLLLGQWQQVVLAEFDNRPRHRQVVVQIIGEE